MDFSESILKSLISFIKTIKIIPDNYNGHMVNKDYKGTGEIKFLNYTLKVTQT